MNRLLLGLALLGMATWLARADEKVSAPDRVARARVESFRATAAAAPEGALWASIETRPFDLPMSLELRSSDFPPRGPLGHVFDDGPPSTGERFRIDGVAPKIVPAEK